MSHAATNWAIKQRGLKPIAKLVLWHLADCHNPTQGCFPTQEYLAGECEVSRASVNRYLDELEDLGLIRREQSVDPETKRQRPTRYFLAFEDEARTQDVVPRVSTVDTDPCLNSEGTRVSENGKAVSHSYETLTSKGTGKGNQEKNARKREDPTDGLVVVSMDSPDFVALTKLRNGLAPPTGKRFTAIVKAAELAEARRKFGTPATIDGDMGGVAA